MSGGFGFGFGSIPFGSAELDPFDFSVVQLTANMVAAPAFTGDDLEAALKVASWSVLALDADAHPRMVQAVQYVTSANVGSVDVPQLVRVGLPVLLLLIDGVLTYGKRYRVTMFANSFDFTAFQVAGSAAPADDRIDQAGIWDISNPFLSRDALVFPTALGTYQVTDAGDVGTDKTLEASLRKRIVRRVLSAANSFFHLQGYGVGIPLKGTITVDMLRRLSSRIQAQVLLEPEVVSCTVELAQDRGDPAVVNCVVTALTEQGKVASVVPLRLP